VIQLDKKTLYIVVAVLVIVIVVGVAAAMLLNNGNNGTPSATPTPTPAPVDVATASTISFSANVTSQGVTTEYKWQGRDIHSDNFTFRLDFATYAYIVNAGTEESWMSMDSGATWTASDYATDLASWNSYWEEYLTNLTHWSGSGDYTYTNADGEAIVLFNITVNPTIADTVFNVS